MDIFKEFQIRANNTKVQLILILVCTSLSFSAYSQKPGTRIYNYKHLTKVDTFSTVVKGILLDYNADCVHKNYFHEGLGIVEVVISKDSANRDVYALTAILDDRYLDHPTDSFTTVGNQIYLLYKGDSNNRKIKTTISEEAIAELKDLLEGKTYLRPPVKEKWEEFYDAAGRKIRRKAARTFTYGNPWNTVFYIFDTPNTYHTLRPL